MSERSPEREYRADAIAVQWEPAFCIHTANCIRALPRVFRPADRPWVHIEEATADQLAAAIERCPTGALHYRRLDGGPAESPRTPAAIQTVPNGPLFVRGAVEVRDSEGNLFRRDTRLALCRCGQSARKPFCDNSHIAAGFRDRGHIYQEPAPDA